MVYQTARKPARNASLIDHGTIITYSTVAKMQNSWTHQPHKTSNDSSPKNGLFTTGPSTRKRKRSSLTPKSSSASNASDHTNTANPAPSLTDTNPGQTANLRYMRETSTVFGRKLSATTTVQPPSWDTPWCGHTSASRSRNNRHRQRHPNTPNPFTRMQSFASHPKRLAFGPTKTGNVYKANRDVAQIHPKK